MEEIKIKVVLVGNTQVGKTTFAVRCKDDVFAKNTESTINVSFFEKIISYDSQNYLLQIWDTAGQEKYAQLAPLSYREADIVLMMFSCDNNDTLEGLGLWESNISSSIDENTIICIVATKSDLLKNDEEEHEILNRAKNKFSNIDSTRFFIISSYSGSGINDMLLFLVRSYLEVKSGNLNKPKGVDIDDKTNSKPCC